MIPRDPSHPRVQVDVFSNPVAMAEFFERQIDDIFRSFGAPGGFFSSPPMGSWGHPGFPPGLNDPNPDENAPGSREFMLKEGVGETPWNPKDPKGLADQDLDSQVAERGLAGIFESPNALSRSEPGPPTGFSRFFGFPNEVS